MHWLLMRRHLWFLLAGEQMWSPLAKQMSLSFTSFGGWEAWVYCRSRSSLWFNECRKALVIFRRSGNTSGRGPTAAFYRGLVEERCNDDLGATLGLEYIQLKSCFFVRSG